MSEVRVEEARERSGIVRVWAIVGSIAAAVGVVAGLVKNGTAIDQFICDRLAVGCFMPHVPRSFSNATERFERDGTNWTEYGNGVVKAHFATDHVDDDFVYVIDRSRPFDGDPDRPFTIRFPRHGGMSEWGFPNPFIWRPLYALSPNG